jgi:purine-binding chemotaxis protein CheW
MNQASTGSPTLGGSESVQKATASGGKFLTFHLGGEEYGLEILKVQEIIQMVSITRMPRTPEFVRGVINLRGKVIPVVDLRLKFGMEEKEDTDRTCVIVVQVTHDGKVVTIGLIVDEVSEVVDIRAEQIEPPPSFGADVEGDFILGMGKLGKKVVILLDIQRVLSTSEIVSLEEVSESE